MKRLIIICLLVIISAAVSGQTEKILNPADLKQQTIITEPISLYKGFLRIGFAYSYTVLDKYFDDSGKKDYFPESAWGKTSGAQFWAQYGITNRIMVELGVPYKSDLTNYHRSVFIPELDTMILSNLTNRGNGLGDIMVSATYQIIPSAENNFSVKASVDLTIPTGQKNPTDIESSGSYKSPTGYGSFVISPRISARMVAYPFSYIGYISYNYNFKGSRIIYPGDLEEKTFKYGNNLIAGGSFNFHLNEWIALTNELNYSYTGKGELEGSMPGDLNSAWGIHYETRLVFQIKRFRLGEAVTIPLAGRKIGADPLYVLIGQYVF